MNVLLSAAPGIPALGPSGASAHLRGVATALGATVVTPRLADYRGARGHLGVPVLPTGVVGWPSWLEKWRDMADISTARRCAAAATRLGPALVWERHALFSDAGWKVRRATGARWILEVNAPLVEERARFEALRDRPLAERWEREVLEAAAAEGEVIAVRQWLVAWLRSRGVEARHVPNGVSRQHGDRDGTRRALGLDNAFVVGFLGSMKPWHGVEQVAAVVEAIEGAVGLVVGEGPVKVDHPRVRCVGHVSEARTADLVAAMDVGLAPYGADAPPWFCPLKILAYRAQGTPVVATKTGDCALLTGEGGTIVDRVDGLVDAAHAWRGRRAAPWVRGWDDVVREVLDYPFTT